MNPISKLKTHEEWEEAWPVLFSLRQDLEREQFLKSREDLISNGYELFGLRSDGRIVSVAGLMIYPHVVRKRDCWIYDLATLEDMRSKGFGKELLHFLEGYAKDRGCPQIHLHTRLQRKDAQRFYEQHAGWDQCAYVYKKSL